MNALPLSHPSRAALLSLALFLGAIEFTAAAYAGEETTWYDKWPEIQAQLSPQVTDSPALAPQEARVAEDAGALRTLAGPVIQDAPPLTFDRDVLIQRDIQLVDPQSASPYDASWFNENPG